MRKYRNRESLMMFPYQIYKEKMEAIRKVYENKWSDPPPKMRKKHHKNRPKKPPVLTVRPEYYSYLASETWRRLRLWRIALADYKCDACNSKENLHVHHLTYERLGAERKEDLQVLCKECHEHAHQIDLQNKEHLRAIQRS